MCIGENIQRTKDAAPAAALKKVNKKKKKHSAVLADCRNHTTQTEMFTEYVKDHHFHAKTLNKQTEQNIIS